MNYHQILASVLDVPSVMTAGDPSSPVVLLADGSSLPSPKDACGAYLLTLPEGTDLRVAAIKWYCQYRIETLAGMTATAQANWQSAMIRLTDILLEGGSLTADEQADRAFARAADSWKNATRKKSDEIEAIEGLSPFSSDASWPGLPDPTTVRPVPKYV